MNLLCRSVRFGLALLVAVDLFCGSARAQQFGACPTAAQSPCISNPVLSCDPDNGQTVHISIDDSDAPGTYTCMPLPSPDPHVPAMGIYDRHWTDPAQGLPEDTFGYYIVDPSGAVRRLPLTIIENLASLGQQQQAQGALVANELPFLVNYLVPTSAVLSGLGPSLGDLLGIVPAELVNTLGVVSLPGGQLAEQYSAAYFSALEAAAGGAWTTYNNTYPTTPSSYTNSPTIYAWKTRKLAAGLVLWQGSYSESKGSNSSSSNVFGSSNNAVAMFEIGEAERVNTTTTNLAGIYVSQKATSSSDPVEFQADSLITVGLALNNDQVMQPLVYVDASEDKAGANGLIFYPSFQEDGFTVGLQTGANKFVPLIGTRTVSLHPFTIDSPACGLNSPCSAAEVRITSVGVYDQSQNYHPVLGFRYVGAKQPLDLWAGNFAQNGAFGNQITGAMAIDSGYFNPTVPDLLNSYVPLLGVTYHDQFGQIINSASQPNNQFQSVITTGAYTPKNPQDTSAGFIYHPLIGDTYDGAVPFENWVFSFAPPPPWLMSQGLFVPDNSGPPHAYIPIFGERYMNSPDNRQEIYQIGAFAGSYSSFIPVFEATYEGSFGDTMPGNLDSGRPATLVQFAGFEGGPGSTAQPESVISAGLVLPTGYQPVIGVQYSNGFLCGRAQNEGLITIGAYLPVAGFVPLAGVSYAAQFASLETSVMFAPFFAPDFYLTEGTYTPGSNGPGTCESNFIPLVQEHVQPAAPILAPPVPIVTAGVCTPATPCTIW